MGKSLSTTFTQSNGTPAQIVGGPAWEAISGTAPTVSGNELLFSTAGASNPIFGVAVGLRMNGKNDVDVTALPKHVYGNCVYTRVVDVNNWIRARVYSYSNTYQYYVTEYEWYDRRWIDTYSSGTLQREVRTTTTTYSYSYGSWSGYSDTGETTACRVDAPTYGLAPVVGAGGGNTTEYRWVSNGNGVGCAAGKATYRKQSRSRTETATPNTSYSYRWVNDGYSLGANENFTGATRVNYSGSYTKVSTNYSTTNPGQTTTPNGPYDAYGATSLNNYATYWAATQAKALDAYTTTPASSRQAGPYNQTDYYYGQVELEKCVGGTITSLGSYYSGSSTPQVLRLRCKAAALEVYYAGVLRISATDAAHATTGTKVGLGGGASPYNSTVARLDDFGYTILTPFRVRNAADTAWINVERPKLRVGGAWVDYDPKRY